MVSKRLSLSSPPYLLLYNAVIYITKVATDQLLLLSSIIAPPRSIVPCDWLIVEDVIGCSGYPDSFPQNIKPLMGQVLQLAKENSLHNETNVEEIGHFGRRIIFDGVSGIACPKDTCNHPEPNCRNQITWIGE